LWNDTVPDSVNGTAIASRSDDGDAMMRRMSFPTRPEALTAGFLSGVFGREVAEVAIAPLGEGWTSAVTAVEVAFADGGTARLVAKGHRTVRAPRQAGRGDGPRTPDGMVRRELEFYRQVAPRLGASVPRVRFAELAPDGDFLLLLDRAPGDHPADGLDLAGATEVLRALATVHGRCWGDPAVREILPARVYAAEEAARLAAGVRDGWESVCARFPRHLAGRPDLGDLSDAVATLVPATLTHNDLHAENLLMGPAGVVFVDWQNASFGSPLYDVANVLAGCVRPEVQRAHGPALLALWEDALVDAGGARVPVLAAGFRAAVGLLFGWVTRYLVSVSAEEAAARSLLLRHWEQVCTGLSITR
jgi:hypothetical protein